MCPILFYHTHFAKEYQIKNYNGNLWIYLNGRKFALKALLDTGNRLYEPFSGKPVCLVEYESLKHCMGNLQKVSGFRMIPYHSIGKKHGVLPGITTEKLIFLNQGEKYEQKGGIIGIYPGKLNRDGEFHAIVHPDILKK